MASPFRQMDDRREDTWVGVSWEVGVKSYVSGAAGGPDGDRRWRRLLTFTRSWVTTGLRRDLRTPLKRHIVRGRGRGGDRYAPTPMGSADFGFWKC